MLAIFGMYLFLVLPVYLVAFGIPIASGLMAVKKPLSFKNHKDAYLIVLSLVVLFGLFTISSNTRDAVPFWNFVSIFLIRKDLIILAWMNFVFILLTRGTGEANELSYGISLFILLWPLFVLAIAPIYFSLSKAPIAHAFLSYY